MLRTHPAARVSLLTGRCTPTKIRSRLAASVPRQSWWTRPGSGPWPRSRSTPTPGRRPGSVRHPTPQHCLRNGYRGRGLGRHLALKLLTPGPDRQAGTSLARCRPGGSAGPGVVAIGMLVQIGEREPPRRTGSSPRARSHVDNLTWDLVSGALRPAHRPQLSTATPWRSGPRPLAQPSRAVDSHQRWLIRADQTRGQRRDAQRVGTGCGPSPVYDARCGEVRGTV